MRILVIDNYDSFTYNLVQLLGKSDHEIIVRRNDRISVRGVAGLRASKILLSPGPGRPENSNVTIDILRELAGEIPVLGVCLGHQAIGHVFGGRIVRAPELMHGKVSPIKHDNRTIFRNLPQNFTATRYHSLIIERTSLPGCMEISSETEDGTIMGIRHRDFQIEGIQFHPESILTEKGNQIIRNWLSL